MKHDPEEKKNLIRVDAYQPLIKKMRAEMYDWLEQTGGMQIPLKDWKRRKVIIYIKILFSVKFFINY